MAHSPIPNVGFFYSGVLHPLRVAEQLMALLALAALTGQSGFVASRFAIFAFLVGLSAGLPLLIYGTPLLARISELTLLSLAACTGIAVASAYKIPARLLQALSFIVAVAVMAGSLQEGVPADRFTLSTFGVVCSAVVIVVVIASWIDLIKAVWARIGVRILGSWIAAAALMVLALSVKALKDTA